MTSDAAASQGPLAGLKLLVVDDQFLVASLAEDIVLEAGAREAVIATSESEARTALERPDRFDGAVIDVNLGDRPGFELARALLKSAIPFVFATGYGGDIALPDEFRGIPVVAKPYTAEMLVAPLAEAIRCGSKDRA
jgi:DNA-binding LytR/AlgR family response regulator